MKEESHHFTMTKLAFGLLILYSIVHLAGFRAYVSVWSGTLAGDINSAFAGITYILLYLVAVCVVPVLILADGLLFWKQHKIPVEYRKDNV